jgi:hypothetical protein
MIKIRRNRPSGKGGEKYPALGKFNINNCTKKRTIARMEVVCVGARLTTATSYIHAI